MQSVFKLNPLSIVSNSKYVTPFLYLGIYLFVFQVKNTARNTTHPTAYFLNKKTGFIDNQFLLRYLISNGILYN